MVTRDAKPIAVCTLTDRALAERLEDVPGVAISAPLMTANLGIEELVRAVLERPSITWLVLCGAESPLFRPGSSLTALARNGAREKDKRIVGAPGYLPYVRGLRDDEVAAFRRQVSVVDWSGERDEDRLRERIADLTASVPGNDGTSDTIAVSRPRFTQIPPGGRRRPVVNDGQGFFVIAVDAERREIVVRHYWADFTPGHEMKGRRGESMLLGLVREGLVTSLSHAGYLGGELAKAETALRFAIDYEQDKPLRPHAVPEQKGRSNGRPSVV